jgi:hypothetical protein
VIPNEGSYFSTINLPMSLALKINLVLPEVFGRVEESTVNLSIVYGGSTR